MTREQFMFLLRVAFLIAAILAMLTYIAQHSARI